MVAGRVDETGVVSGCCRVCYCREGPSGLSNKIPIEAQFRGEAVVFNWEGRLKGAKIARRSGWKGGHIRLYLTLRLRDDNVCFEVFFLHSGSPGK